MNVSCHSRELRDCTSVRPSSAGWKKCRKVPVWVRKQESLALWGKPLHCGGGGGGVALVTSLPIMQVEVKFLLFSLKEPPTLGKASEVKCIRLGC